MPLTPIIEAQALRETEDALREFVRVAHNVGLAKPSIAMMLRSVADEMDPPHLIVPGSEALN